MAAVARLKFIQGLVTGADGQALVGVAGTAVNVHNVDNTGVQSWEIDLLYTPPGSAVAVALPLAFNNSSGTPLASFTPDVRGSYRVRLQVWTLPNHTGILDTDIRNFVILTAKRGLVLPPYQNDPLPLPTLASGLPGAKSNEMNINGNEFGWEGLTGDGQLADLIDLVDTLTTGGGLVSLSGAANTLILADAGKTLLVSNAATTTLTIPPNSSVAFPLVTEIFFIQTGVGQLVVAAGGGVTIRTPETLKLRKQYSIGSILKVGTDEWVLSGDLELA